MPPDAAESTVTSTIVPVISEEHAEVQGVHLRRLAEDCKESDKCHRERESERERERETHRDTERHRETQRDTERGSEGERVSLCLSVSIRPCPCKSPQQCPRPLKLSVWRTLFPAAEALVPGGSRHPPGPGKPGA